MVKHGSNQNPEDDRGTFGVSGNQKERQQLGFIANFSDGNGKRRSEKSIHSAEPQGGDNSDMRQPTFRPLEVICLRSCQFLFRNTMAMQIELQVC